MDYIHKKFETLIKARSQTQDPEKANAISSSSSNNKCNKDKNDSFYEDFLNSIRLPSFVRKSMPQETMIKTILGRQRFANRDVTDDSLTNTTSHDPDRNSIKNKKRELWILMMMILVIYNIFVLPLRVAFEIDVCITLFVFDTIFDILFLIDAFLTLKLSNSLIITRRIDEDKKKEDYFYTYFFVDLISSIPLEAIVLISVKDRSYLSYSRITRMGRFFRIPRLFEFISHHQDQITLNSHGLRIIKIIFLILSFAHLDACIQFWVAKIEGFTGNCWVTLSNIINESRPEQYTHSLFMALSHMLCIGYGQEPPKTTFEIWATIISMVVGASFYIILSGIMTSLLLSMDRGGAMYDEHIGAWSEYFRHRGLSPALRRRITRYIHRRYSTRKIFDEEALLNHLPENLRVDINLFLCDELISNVPIFKACKPVVVRALVSKLDNDIYLPGDLVFYKGEPADNLYFISSGRVLIENDNGVIVTELSRGSFFGEFSLLAYYRGDSRTHRMANAKSVTYTNIYKLSCKNFKEVADRFPEVVTILESIAEARDSINRREGKSNELR